jgi:hypothetical protein
MIRLNSLSVAAMQAGPGGIAFTEESAKLGSLQHQGIGLTRPVSLFPLKRQARPVREIPR